MGGQMGEDDNSLYIFNTNVSQLSFLTIKKEVVKIPDSLFPCLLRV